jgi:SAM-dependent methyltransferase
MLQDILRLASASTYDFRVTACPQDPLRHKFADWVPYYRLKWAIARVLQPRSILEIGVRFGYSAATFLNACPGATYLGIDNDSETYGGHKGAIQWARQITSGADVEYLIADSQQLAEFPGGMYDLIHIDGQQDGVGSINDLRKALGRAKYILVDGFFWTRENFLHVSEFLWRYRDVLESIVVIPGYAGELLITPLRIQPPDGPVANSAVLRPTYTESYYLQDCGGFDGYKNDKGLHLSDWRLRSVADLADLAPVGRAVDLGCGRGEISVHLARVGHDVLAIDYSDSAIALAQAAASENADPASKITFHCDDVNEAPLTGLYDVAVASDLVEHMSRGELERLYSRVASHLSPKGVFVVHTFPNLWYYTYGYRRRLREARKIQAYLPLEPRSRFEELMHINEQSPRVLKRQLEAHFEHVVLWFADHTLESPFENLKRPFTVAELRSAGDLFALASHSPINKRALLDGLAMRPMLTLNEMSLEVRQAPSIVAAGSRFRIQVRLLNHSGVELKSQPPNPIHLSYHCYTANQELVVFDGIRTRMLVSKPGFAVNLKMDLEAPAAQGRFRFRLTLVQEGIRWLDETPLKLFADCWIDVM